MHLAGPTFESFGKKPRFYPSHTYLVENAISSNALGWVAQNPGFTRSLYSQNPGSSRVTSDPETDQSHGTPVRPEM
jgi:hypothetical protein